jgi:hypothetical protein
VRIYSLTKLGKRATSNRTGDEEELKVLDYLRNNVDATDNQLDTVGERYLVRRLKERGLVKELTQ